MQSAYTDIQETFQQEYKGLKGKEYPYKKLFQQRMMAFRAQKESVARLERPTNIARAHTLGYKAKEGFLIVRARVRKGSGMHRRPKKARRPKRMGVIKLTRNLSIQQIAEQRAARKYINFEVLNSYFVGQDGRNKYFEIILVNPGHPAILASSETRWIANKDQVGRAFRGLTSAGKKSRGLRNKGHGYEKARRKKISGWKKIGYKKTLKPGDPYSH